MGKITFLGPETPRGVYLKTYTEKKQLNIYQDVAVTRTQHPDRQTDRQSHFIVLDAYIFLPTLQKHKNDIMGGGPRDANFFFKNPISLKGSAAKSNWESLHYKRRQKNRLMMFECTG